MSRGKKGGGWSKPVEEIQEALAHQIEFIRSSCKLFDTGSLTEALRIATAVHIIVHDGGQISLLTQLKARSSLRFINSARPINPQSASPYHPLFGMMLRGDGSAAYIPNYGSPEESNERQQFHRWWEKQSIFDDPCGSTINRRRLVFSLRSQDGGGHFDPSLTDPVYVGISRHNLTGWKHGSGVDGNVAKDFPPGAHFAMMRVIAWELERTLVDGGIIAGPVSTGNPGAPPP